MPDESPEEVLLRLLGREAVDLVEACFEANTALPRSLQETLGEAEAAAIRSWQAWAIDRRGRAPGASTPLVDPELPRLHG
jgi:hypothetical protein